jgi:hypothetical protein
MRNALVILCLLTAAAAPAARTDDGRPRPLERVASERKARVLRDARAVFNLDDGSEWITHSVPAAAEPSAIGVTRFDAGGDARVFLVSDWLPKGTIPRGRAGQVYSVALLTDGRVAVSAGWNDGASHNAIFVLHALDDGRYAADKVIELPGVAQVGGGPRNTIAAVTVDASIAGGGPMLTIFDTDGRSLGRFFDGDPSLGAREAVQNANAARLQRVGERRFALYDRASGFLRLFDVDVADARAQAATRSFVDVGNDLAVLAIQPAADGDFVVARSGMIRGRLGTELTVYDGNGVRKESTLLEHPWNFVLRENGRLRGVVMRDGVMLDNVR